MSRKIIGVTVGTPTPRANLKQTDPRKADYVKGKDIIPEKVSQLENDAGYLTDSALPEVVNTALALAKESGEFDGEPGRDGKDGADGKDGRTPQVKIISGHSGIPGSNSIFRGSVKIQVIVQNEDGTASAQSGEVWDGVGVAAIYKRTTDGNEALCFALTDGSEKVVPFPSGGGSGGSGEPGTDGITPHIGENGNWFIGETDTGVKAQGEDGKDGDDYVLTDTDRTEIAEQAAQMVIDDAPVKSVNGKTGAVVLSASDVGADASGTAGVVVSGHNVHPSAHNDIRLLITGLTNRLDALANADDDTLDQMAEVVAYIKANRDLIEQITTNKVNVADIINNLTTNVSNKPLSAAQGVALKALIDALDNGKLNASELTAAINTALAQAKASGEFKGDKGDTGATGATGATGSAGVSVSSVKQTTTSSADGGSNVVTVTLSNGTTSTFTVKNGSKGSTGAAGATPVKGTDYWTPADKAEMVSAVIAALPDASEVNY